jgi:glyoxylase-like metal-dependent hydrolase (beta-lactamase superfamily II)
MTFSAGESPDREPAPAENRGEQRRLYFRQLLAGRDFARDDLVARQMVNFVYLIGDRDTGDAMLVDPAYGVGELVDMVGTDGLSVSGVLVTHYHPDHVGGDLMGYRIEGVRELLAMDGVSAPLHVQRDEAPWVKRVTGASDSDLVAHDSGDEVRIGDIPVRLVHTPGHTPGSQCFLVDGRLVAGDTLFLDGCGRTDLPGGDPQAMYESLTQRLAAIPDDTVLYPGHLYSPEPSATLGDTRRRNYVFRFRSLDQWLTMFGG